MNKDFTQTETDNRKKRIYLYDFLQAVVEDICNECQKFPKFQNREFNLSTCDFLENRGRCGLANLILEIKEQ